MKLMITDGGPHPADKWADTTVEAILDLIQIASDSVSPEAAAARQAKRELAPKLFAILNKHHEDVQTAHRGALKKLKSSQLGQEIDVAPHMSTADSVLAAFVDTPFAKHFAKPEVQKAVESIIGQHTSNVIHIERSWHADSLTAKGA